MKKKCSFKEHKEIDAINYCNKCLNYHKGLYENHNLYNLEVGIKEIFTGLCNEEKHNDELEYFCKTHNVLCCDACLCKIKEKGNGQHSNCDVCIIENIKDEKIQKLDENIKFLENLSKNFEKSNQELKSIFEKLTKNKDELKE